MVQINFARREVNCKIVFYGPGLSGKTTNLEIIHKKVPAGARGQLTSIATEQDRTLFFDFMPLDLGTVAGMKTKLFLYTVPGQVYYNSTRKLVLQGADGIVFVADSDPNRMPDNLESLKDLEENLKEYGIDMRRIPLVLQFNKRDLPGAMPMAEMNAKLNSYEAPTFEAVAVKGDGVMQTLKGLSKIVIEKLNDDYAPGKVSGPAKPASAVVSAPPAAPAEVKQKSAMPPAVPPPPPKPKTAAQPAVPRPEPVVATKAPPPPPPRVQPVAPPRPQPIRENPMPGVQPPRPSGGSKSWIWILIVVLLLGGGAAWYFVGGGKATIEKMQKKAPEQQK